MPCHRFFVRRLRLTIGKIDKKAKLIGEYFFINKGFLTKKEPIAQGRKNKRKAYWPIYYYC
jgi:hypothetical protein